MMNNPYEKIIKQLSKNGIQFEKGLSDIEIRKAEQLFEITFPEDLKEFIETGLPIGDPSSPAHFQFPNWRLLTDENISIIKDRLNWPLEGILFEIEHNNFWYDKWGQKPKLLKESFEICKEEFKKIPKLIPIQGHRYMPSQPSQKGNPIYSVWQTDIIYYGHDLESFLKKKPVDYKKVKFYIKFWSDIAG